MASVYASPLCQACLTLPHGVSTSQAHADLRLLGQHPPSADGAHETQYRCLSCQTHWLLRTNRWGIPEGFRLKPV